MFYLCCLVFFLLFLPLYFYKLYFVSLSSLSLFPSLPISIFLISSLSCQFLLCLIYLFVWIKEDPQVASPQNAVVYNYVIENYPEHQLSFFEVLFFLSYFFFFFFFLFNCVVVVS